MTLYEMAFQIYLKKMPSGYVNDATLASFSSTAKQCIDAAKAFDNAALEVALEGADEVGRDSGPVPEETI
jgi:hypothetical protein